VVVTDIKINNGLITHFGFALIFFLSLLLLLFYSRENPDLGDVVRQFKELTTDSDFLQILTLPLLYMAFICQY
jgi:amino acid permease